MGNCIRIMIVDDHIIVREGLNAVIGLEDDMELVGEAGDGLEAVEKARELKPDVILMDLMMPRKDGIEAINEILRENPEVRILVLTSFTEIDQILPTIHAGALGYIGKNSKPQELLNAIRNVYQGAVYMQPDIARQLFYGLSESSKLKVYPVDVLTKREIEVLKLVGRGMTNDEIAERLVVSSRTVGVHIGNILAKLNLNNRTQAALYALRKGLISLFAQE